MPEVGEGCLDATLSQSFNKHPGMWSSVWLVSAGSCSLINFSYSSPFSAPVFQNKFRTSQNFCCMTYYQENLPGGEDSQSQFTRNMCSTVSQKNWGYSRVAASPSEMLCTGSCACLVLNRGSAMCLCGQLLKSSVSSVSSAPKGVTFQLLREHKSNRILSKQKALAYSQAFCG